MCANIDNFLDLKNIQTKIHQNIEFTQAFFQNGEDQLVKIFEHFQLFRTDLISYYSRLKNIISKHAKSQGVAFTTVKDPNSILEYLTSRGVIPEGEQNLYDIYLNYFPQYFNYFIFKHEKMIEQGRRTVPETHLSLMADIYKFSTDKSFFFNLAKVEFLTPQFIRFLNKNLDISHIFFKSTFNRDDSIAQQEFLENFSKNLHKCPEYIIDLINIDKNVITESLKPLITQHPQLLNLVPYYVNVKNNQFDVKISPNIKKEISQIQTRKTSFIPEDVKNTIETMAGTNYLETEMNMEYQCFRDFLKILPPLPIIQNKQYKMTINGFLKFAINMVHSEKRQFYLDKLNEICKDDRFVRLLNKTRNDHNANVEIKKIKPREKLLNAEQSIRYSVHHQFLIKYEEKLREIQNQIIGYSFVVCYSDDLRRLYPEIYNEYQIHMKFIDDNYKEKLNNIRLECLNMDLMCEKHFTNIRAANLDYFINGETQAFDFQVDLFKNEKWISKKHKFVTDLSYDKDPFELYKIFDSYQSKMMKKFVSKLSDLGADQATPFYDAYVSHCMPHNLISTLKYISLYKMIFPATQFFFERILASLDIRIFDE